MSGVDPHVIATWVHAWAHFRGAPRPQARHGGWYIEVGQPDQKARYVFAQLDAAQLRALAESIDEPFVFLKVCAPADDVMRALPPGWELQRPGYFMMTPLASAPRLTATPEGYTMTSSNDGDIFIATALDGSGVRVASGSLLCTESLAAFHRVETDEAHRRRGLARAIMATLSAEAHTRGARDGALVATPMGRALYAELGWRLEAPYTTAVIPAS